jgi:O-antigen/teichoic acid export membrane protein
VFGEELLITAFGPEYAGGYLALVVLATGQLLNAAAGSVGALLNMTGHARDTVAGLLAGAILNATLNLVLIPLYGIEGAAYATAITFVFWNVLLHRKVRQRLGIESSAFLPTPLPKAAPATHSRRS